MNPTSQPMRAFLGDPALKAHYLARARDIAADNTAFVQEALGDRPAATGASLTSTVATTGSNPTATTSSAARADKGSSGLAPSSAALAAALASGSPAVGRPMTGAQPAAANARPTGQPRRLWLPEETDDLAFFSQRLGLPMALAELLGEFALAMPPQRMPGFALECLEAIAPGADLSAVGPAFVAWLVNDPAVGALRFSVSPAVRAATHAVGQLHAAETLGQHAARTTWAAARRAAQASADRAVADLDRAVAGFAAEAAWSCASSRGAALQSLRVWQFSLGSLAAQQSLSFGRDDQEAFGRARDAFWLETTELRKSMLAAGESRQQYEALFAQRHPDLFRRHEAYAVRARADQAALILPAGDRLLALLREAPRSL